MEVLKGIVREQSGTTKARKLRLEGLTPGIIYGHGQANVSFAVDSHDLELLVGHGERLVKLELDGDSDNYLLKDVQRDAFDNEIVHIDLVRVNLDEKVEVNVPITLKGTAPGEKEGGVVTPAATEITISCPVVSIPDEIVLRISGLELNGSLHVSDISADGFEIITDPETVLVSCHMVAEEPEEEEGESEEGDVEPEVISKGKDEEDQE